MNILSKITGAAALGLVALAASPAMAALTINSVTLDGGAPPITVAPGATISVNVNATVTNTPPGTSWGSTSWQFEGGSANCVNHPDHAQPFTGGETFNITAPLVEDTYNLTIVISSNTSNCAATIDTEVLVDAVTIQVATPTPDVTKTLLDGPNDAAGDPCEVDALGSTCDGVNAVSVNDNDAGGIWVGLTESQHYVFEIEIANETGDDGSWVVNDAVPADFDMDAVAEDRADGLVDTFCDDSVCDGVTVSGSGADACSVILSQPPSGDGVGGDKEPEFIDISVDELADEDSCVVTVYVMTVENPGLGNDLWEPTGCRLKNQTVDPLVDLIETYTLNEGVRVYELDPAQRLLGPIGSLQLTCNFPADL